MKTAPFQLSAKQKRQVTLLYHFASLDYLKGLQDRVNALLIDIDPTLDQAKLDQRDQFLNVPRWGSRNTSENWSNNAWPFLADFQRSIAEDIAKRAVEVYSVTDANNCARGLAELSTAWMSPDEEQEFDDRMDLITKYAMNIDYTLAKSHKAGRWSDFSLTRMELTHPSAFDQAPALRLRADVSGQSGAVPPRTGVYLPIDDPYGTPQFCWTGNPAGPLQECRTFNMLGESALSAIGISDLWTNDASMHAFVQDHLTDPILAGDPFFSDSIQDPGLAASLVSRHAFASHPCVWIFVEQIHGDIEDWSESAKGSSTETNRPRVEAGAPCLQDGYYFTPVKTNSRRRFVIGEIMPHVVGDYGATIWQWDADQG